MSMNTVNITGYLVRDADYKTSAGVSVCSFTVAQNYPKKTGDKREDDVNYIRTAVFGERADGIHRYLKKGVLVGITGHLETGRWESGGVKHSRLEVRTDRLELLSKKDDEPESDGEPNDDPDPAEFGL